VLLTTALTVTIIDKITIFCNNVNKTSTYITFSLLYDFHTKTEIIGHKYGY